MIADRIVLHRQASFPSVQFPLEGRQEANGSIGYPLDLIGTATPGNPNGPVRTLGIFVKGALKSSGSAES